MERISLGYKGAQLEATYDSVHRIVQIDVAATKERELKGRRVPPFNGSLTLRDHDFIQLLKGAWGIGWVRVVSEEGIAVETEYDWRNWERGDDMMKLKITQYPERRSILYLRRQNLLILSAFLKRIKNLMSSYAFATKDLQFIRSEGETIISQAGEELVKFTLQETRALRGAVENALLGKGEIPRIGIDISAYPKARWVFAPNVYVPKPLHILYMCLA